MSLYIVDTNFFTQAHRTNYPLDVAASYWKMVKDLANAGQIRSIDKVMDEIYINDDDLKVWCQSHLPNDFFIPTSTPETINCYKQVINWALGMNHHYKSSAISEFMQDNEADAFLISHALTDVANLTLVTYEIPAPDGKNKIKIPDVCNHFGLTYLKPIEMLRVMGKTF